MYTGHYAVCSHADRLENKTRSTSRECGVPKVMYEKIALLRGGEGGG